MLMVQFTFIMGEWNELGIIYCSRMGKGKDATIKWARRELNLKE